jgi:putative redox protein
MVSLQVRKTVTKTIDVTFPGGLRVDAHYAGRTVCTDQSVKNGGGESAPEPFDLFFVSIATCVGIYALDFCKTHEMGTEGLGVRLETEWNRKKKTYDEIRIVMILPTGFPEEHEKAIYRAVDLCAVKRHIVDPAHFDITLKRSDSR